MRKIKKSTYIMIGFICLFFVFALIQTKGYFLTSFESKYVTSSIFANSFSDILKADFNGINVFEGGPLYFLITKLFIQIIGSNSEFVVRLPVLALSCITALIFYFFCKHFTNRTFSLISILVFSLTVSFLTFSSLSNPQIMAANFAFISILFLSVPLLEENNKNKQQYFIGFWIFTFLVVFTDLFTAVVPIAVLIISYLLLKKLSELLKTVNILLALFSLFLIIYNWQMLSYKVSENIPLFDYIFNTGSLHIQPYIFIKYFIGLIAGLMPWSVLFITILVLSAFTRSFRNEIINKKVENCEKIFALSLIGFFVSSTVFFLNHSYSNIILATSFASICISFFWYKYIDENKYKGVFNFSSSLFFCMTLLVAVSVIFVYFFIDNTLKIYFEPILVPLIVLTLLVAIPGMIVVMLDRKWLIFSVHLIFSLIFYIILTEDLFNYFNSFGESELITFAYGSKDNVGKLATYDIKNKYVIPYYFGNIVEFNGKISPEEIFEKYGDTYDVRIITTIKNLEDFDKYFVYELLDSGKSYCVITNIKKLPKDYLKNRENTKSNF